MSKKANPFVSCIQIMNISCFILGRPSLADLVAANRLYRQTAASAGDETMADVLDELLAGRGSGA